MSLNESVNTLQTLLSNLNFSDAKFATGLIAAYKKYGNLTPKQAPWVEKLIERAQPKPVFSAPLVLATTGYAAASEVTVGGFEGVIGLFNAAKAHLKHPKISLSCSGKTLKLALLGVKSKFNGSVNITNGGKYPLAVWYGRVSPEGVFTPSAKLAPDFVTALTALLQEFSKNPARVAKDHGKLTGNCCFCNKELGLGEDKRSVVVGFGPVCAGHYGLKAEWLSGAAKAEAKAEVEVLAKELAEFAPEDAAVVVAPAFEAPAVISIEAGNTSIEVAEWEPVVDGVLPPYSVLVEANGKTCFFCEEKSLETKELHGYIVCAKCVSELNFVQGQGASA